MPDADGLTAADLELGNTTNWENELSMATCALRRMRIIRLVDSVRSSTVDMYGSHFTVQRRGCKRIVRLNPDDVPEYMRLVSV